MYLYNKNILKYVEIVGSEPKSMILNTEGRSNIYIDSIWSSTIPLLATFLLPSTAEGERNILCLL